MWCCGQAVIPWCEGWDEWSQYSRACHKVAQHRGVCRCDCCLSVSKPCRQWCSACTRTVIAPGLCMYLQAGLLLFNAVRCCSCDTVRPACEYLEPGIYQREEGCGSSCHSILHSVVARVCACVSRSGGSPCRASLGCRCNVPIPPFKADYAGPSVFGGGATACMGIWTACLISCITAVLAGELHSAILINAVWSLFGAACCVATKFGANCCLCAVAKCE